MLVVFTKIIILLSILFVFLNGYSALYRPELLSNWILLNTFILTVCFVTFLCIDLNKLCIPLSTSSLPAYILQQFSTTDDMENLAETHIYPYNFV